MFMKRYKQLIRLHTGATRLALTIAGLGYAGTTPVEGIDPAVVPGDDFFTYANGAWLKATEIPADRSVYGTGSIVAELNLQRVAKLIEQAAQGSVPIDAQSRAIGDFYSSYMDEAAIEKRGIAPLEGTLRRIAAITNRKMLARALGESLRSDVDVLNNTEVHTPNLFGVWIAADLNDPTRYVPFLVQGGLVMPDRDYYVDPSPGMAEIRKQYEAHIAALLRLARIPDAGAKATRIADLEHRIAEKHWSRADTEQVAKANNPWKRADFERRAPGLDWEAFFTAAHLNQVSDFIVWQPSALQGLSALVASEELDTWKDWLRLHALEHAADTLPKAFVDEEFSFHGKVLTGAVELRPRWKRAVDATNAALGEAVGRLYAAKYFPPSEKARVEAMVRTLITAFGARIDRLEWMSPQTRGKAKAKLSTLKVSVGYPDKWRDYSGLKIVRGDAFGNAERSELFEYRRVVRRHRTLRALVGAGRLLSFCGRIRPAGRSVQPVQTVSGPGGQRKADVEREHRRPGGDLSGPRCLSAITQRDRAPARVRVYCRSIVLSQLCAELAYEVSRAGFAQASYHRRTRPRPVPGSHCAQRGRVVCGLRRETGPVSLPGTGRSRPHLVTRWLKIACSASTRDHR